MIRGTGIDIIKIKRIETLREKWGNKFLNKIFVESEINYCLNQARPAVHLAARFSAKEAVFKMLETGVSWQEITVVKKDNGKPVLKLSGKAQKIARDKGIKKIFVSLSHERDYAIAQVIGEGEIK